MLQILRCAAFLPVAMVFSLTAQTPAWISFQGRVSVAGQPFQGWGEFKFALVEGAPEPRVLWHHDGTDPARQSPLSSLRLRVTNGWFEVGLGDTTVSNMAPLSAPLGGVTDLRVRVWFHDGVRGWEQMTPDLRVGAVPYALHAGQLPPQSITWSHFTPDLQTRLSASNTAPALPEGAVLPVSLAQASNWLQAGYAPYPLQLAPTAWRTEYLDPRLTPAFLTAPGTNLWDGNALWLWRWGAEGQPGQGARYDLAAGRWQMVTSANAPAFDPARAWAVTVGGDLLMVEAGVGGWQARWYRPAAQAWETGSIPSHLLRPGTVRWLDTPSGPVVLTATESALAGAWYEAASHRWHPVPTNGAPALDWSSAQFATWSGGWLALGTADGEAQLWHCQLAPPGWQRLSTEGFSLTWSTSLRAVWTGAEWYWLEPQPAGWRGVRYIAASGRWQGLPEANAPLAHPATQCLWNGRELFLINLTATPVNEAVYSARLDPQLNRWQPMNPAAPVSVFGPPPQLVALPDAVFMARVSDPTRYAIYDCTADCWQPLDGPNLGFEALVIGTGREVLALPYQVLPEEPRFFHRYSPPQRIGWFYKPAP